MAMGLVADGDDPGDEDAVVAEEDDGIAEEDLAACLRVLNRLSGDRSLLEGSRFRSVRKVLMGLLDDARERLPNKAATDRQEKNKHEKLMKRQRRQIQAEADRRWIDNGELRRARLGALEELQGGSAEASLRIPDGAAAATLPKSLTDGSLTAAELDVPLPLPCNEAVELGQPRACYVCHRRFTTLHHFYDRLCPSCADLNWQKRHHAVSLSADFVAFVTGGRVKIGFEVARKLLRCGATVLVTSRFPRDCCRRFAELPEFSEFSSRLHVYGVDFRSLGSVHRLCAELDERCPHLDAVVHNACQTVRRPVRYYRDLVALENEPCAAPQCLALGAGGSGDVDAAGDMSTSVALAHREGGEQMMSSAAMSQLRVLAEDFEAFEAEMPEGARDVNGQQLDLREKHSWKLRLHEVSTEELVECLCVNTIAPFTLNAKLKELLLRSPRKQRFIVNVSAMEGKFYRSKTVNHPHTNMAKAALNMMTRTSAQDYAVDGIFMNSVDTGWINDENPLPTAHRIASEHHFQSPIDEVDAAARILDPIFTPLAEGVQPLYGKFFKDYAETEW